MCLLQYFFLVCIITFTTTFSNSHSYRKKIHKIFIWLIDFSPWMSLFYKKKFLFSMLNAIGYKLSKVYKSEIKSYRNITYRWHEFFSGFFCSLACSIRTFMAFRKKISIKCHFYWKKKLYLFYETFSPLLQVNLFIFIQV